MDKLYPIIIYHFSSNMNNQGCILSVIIPISLVCVFFYPPTYAIIKFYICLCYCFDL